MIKVAINGFGRIGRLAFRELIKSKKIEIVAINDLSTPSMLAYLLKYDSIQGTFKAAVSHTDNSIIVDNKNIAVYAERVPQNVTCSWNSSKVRAASAAVFVRRFSWA